MKKFQKQICSSLRGTYGNVITLKKDNDDCSRIFYLIIVHLVLEKKPQFLLQAVRIVYILLNRDD